MNSLLIFYIAILAILFHLSLSFELNDYNSTSSSTCFCTTVPCPVEGENYLAAGGGSVGTYIYKLTSSNYPVVSSASITITADDIDHGTDTTTCTQNYARSLDDDGVEDCDAGHILANRLGGKGNQPINIFPQNLHINRGIYATFEGEIYSCISASGATSADLAWTFTYATPANTKPSSVTYSAKFSGGTCTSLYEEFTNEGR